MRSVRYKNNCLFYLDQTQLPLKEVWRECRSLKDSYIAIKQLRVRGAPLIGVFAAYSIAISMKQFSKQKDAFLREFKEAVDCLKACRPTAVNLFWALNRLDKEVAKIKEKSLEQIKKVIVNEARAIHKEDVILCEKMAEYGVKLVKNGDRILTHCNTGFLATSGEGTALAVIYKAAKMYKNIKVYADETRPLLQGARLTAWELMKKRVPSVVICDNMAASLMKRKAVDKIFVGADRVVVNGDVANKIGTYSLAIVAKYHKIPFYVVAPFSSFDFNLDRGEDIPIEERSPDEIRKVLNKVYITPRNAKTYSPAFDITGHKLITAIVTDKGIIYPPFVKNIKKVLCR